MKAVVKWQGEACYEAETESGHKVLMDGPPDHGGQNRGPRPMETLLLGVGGCSSFDVIHIPVSYTHLTLPTILLV